MTLYCTSAFSLACNALEGLRLIDAFIQEELAID